MPSRKRHHHPRATPIAATIAPAPSDYETDTANLTDVASSALQHPPPRRTNTELNLAVLRRYLPGVQRIVAIAPFAVVYTFSSETQSWEKCPTEGTLFVCEAAGPHWTVVVLNRKSLDTFIVPLRHPDDVEITPEYVILQAEGQDGQPLIYGLWIFSDANVLENTREAVGLAIEECAARAHEAAEGVAESMEPEEQYPVQAPIYAEEPIQHEAQPQTTGQSLDLSQLFAKPLPQQPIYDPQPAHMYPTTHPQHFAHETPHFALAAGTDFYRTEYPPTQVHPVMQHQNTLLNLFKK